MLTANLRNLGRVALDLVYPPRCVLCSLSGAFLCVSCLEALPRADGWRCARCWLPLQPNRECRRCQEWPYALTGLRSAFRYEDRVRRIIKDLKFQGLACLVEPLTAPLADVSNFEADVVTAVPMHSMRQRVRGYNQAQLLARSLSQTQGLAYLDALRRSGKQQPQVELRADERRRNMQGAFTVVNPREIARASVLVVDDVATTGATLDACARALLAAGAREVHGLTLARED